MVADGISDRDRIALGGHSYGGNTAQVAASQLVNSGLVSAVGNFPGGLCPLGVFGCNAHGIRVPILIVSPSSDVNQIGVKENVFRLIPASTPKVWVSLSGLVGHSDVMRADSTILKLAEAWFKWILLEDDASANAIYGRGGERDGSRTIRTWRDVIGVDVVLPNADAIARGEAVFDPKADLPPWSSSSSSSDPTLSVRMSRNGNETDANLPPVARAVKLAARAFTRMPDTAAPPSSSFASAGK